MTKKYPQKIQKMYKKYHKCVALKGQGKYDKNENPLKIKNYFPGTLFAF